MEYRESPPARPYVEDSLKLAQTALPPLLRYVFLGRDDTFLVIIAADLNVQQVDCFPEVLKRFK